MVDATTDGHAFSHPPESPSREPTYNQRCLPLLHSASVGQKKTVAKRTTYQEPLDPMYLRLFFSSSFYMTSPRWASGRLPTYMRIKMNHRDLTPVLVNGSECREGSRVVSSEGNNSWSNRLCGVQRLPPRYSLCLEISTLFHPIEYKKVEQTPIRKRYAS